MTTLDQAARIALALPNVTEIERHHHRAWAVQGKVFAWERPFSKADVKRFGDQTPPDGPIVATSVADLNEKEAVLATDRPGLFTIAHFDGYPAVLIQLRRASVKTVREALVDGWLTCAPPAVAEQYLKTKRKA